MQQLLVSILENMKTDIYSHKNTLASSLFSVKLETVPMCTDNQIQAFYDFIRREQTGGNMMKRSTTNKAKGIFHEVKGAIKAEAGKLTGNRALQAKGVAEKTAGKIQKKIGQMEKAIEKR